MFNEELPMSAIEWMAEQIPGGFFVYRAEPPQEIVYVNGMTLHIFGCETAEEFAELTGNRFAGLVHPEDAGAIRRSIDEQIADTAHLNFGHVEYRIIRKDGTVRWVDDYGHFAQYPGLGDVFYVFISDITDRHNLQEQVRRREKINEGMIEQLNDLADNSLAVYRANISTGEIEMARGRDLFDADRVGGSLAESLQAHIDSLLTEEDRRRYRKIFDPERMVQRYYDGKGPETFTAYSLRQSGRQCFVKFSNSVVVDPGTGDVILLGVETEYNSGLVTELLTEKVLAQQYDMVTYIVGESYGVVIGKPENIKHGSIFPKRLEGNYAEYIETQVLPLADGTVHETEQLERALSLEHITEMLAEHDSYAVDVTCVVEGETVNKRFTFYAVDMAAHFYILLKSDVTDVLREERERSELLSNALREAEHANMAKTTFLSNMSHEIRTPMNAIIGYNSIALKNPDLPEDTRECLTRIESSSKHLLGLINDILDMSRIESGQMMVKREEFSLRDMIDQVNAMVKTQCDEKGVAFECRTADDVDEFYIGDDMKLKQVVLNMLDNAVKFTDAPGEVRFSVEKTASFDDRSTLRFVVEDTGIGMDESFIPHVFGAFTQEDETSANRFGSTGLGMAIAKNIVEMMNGTITVDSKKGEGTRFEVVVTLRNSAREASDEEGQLPKELKVLIVDDEAVECEHARLVLEEVGIEADTCLSGEEALNSIELQYARQEPYDLILMDWKMPELDGIDVTREVRARHDDNTTIVILTTYNWDEIMDEALEAGVDGFMAKPLFAGSVMGEFEKIVKRKKPKQQVLPVNLAGRRVLLAEDVEINAEIVIELLGMRDMEVEHAENGKIALDMFQESAIGYYDAVLMDIRMPVLNGLEATSAIRALDRTDAKAIPIIALTANALDEDVQNSLQVGMSAHLSKPVEVDLLFSTLERLISQRIAHEVLNLRTLNPIEGL